jgi:hypothetical protein
VVVLVFVAVVVESTGGSRVSIETLLLRLPLSCMEAALLGYRQQLKTKTKQKKEEKQPR